MAQQDDRDSVDEGIEATVMAIRELIMEYFKGTCVEKVTTNRNVTLISLQNYRAEFQYQRRQIEAENSKLMLLDSVPILTMSHVPDRLILHTKVLDRSKELRKVKAKLEDFMDKYLIGVDIIFNEGVVLYG